MSADRIDIIRKAMMAARLQLSLTNNLLVTDRPDLPRSPDTSWTTDHRLELSGLEEAMKVLDEVA